MNSDRENPWAVGEEEDDYEGYIYEEVDEDDDEEDEDNAQDIENDDDYQGVDEDQDDEDEDNDEDFEGEEDDEDENDSISLAELLSGAGKYLLYVDLLAIRWHNCPF
jgi:hypothetical protein